MRALFSQLLSHEIRLLLITGQIMSISAKDAWRIFFDKDSAVFFGAAFCLVTFLFPISSEFEIPWWMKLAGFSLYFALIPVIYFIQAIFVASVSRKLPGLQFFEPVFLLLAAFAIEAVDHKISPLFFGEIWTVWIESSSYGEQVVGTFILLLSLDVMFCYFVLPHKQLDYEPETDFSESFSKGEENFLPADPYTIRADGLELEQEPVTADQTGLESPSNESTAPAAIELDGTEVPISSILAVRAEEHYVRVWTNEDEIYARHPFGELIAMMDDADGFSPRRGIWFNFENIDDVCRGDNGKLIVTPVTGPVAVVPKARAREVRQLLKQQRSNAAVVNSAPAFLDKPVPGAAESGTKP